jgi:hypothetical protein
MAIFLQLVIVAFVLFAMSRVIIRFHDHQMTLAEVLLWSFVWIGLAVATLLPNVAHVFSRWLGISRPIDILVYGSIALLLYLVFRLYIQIENANFQITRITRALAIERAPKKR